MLYIGTPDALFNSLPRANDPADAPVEEAVPAETPAAEAAPVKAKPVETPVAEAAEKAPAKPKAKKPAAKKS